MTTILVGWVGIGLSALAIGLIPASGFAFAVVMITIVGLSSA